MDDATEQNDTNLSALREAVSLAHEGGNNLLGIRAELAVAQSRPTKLEGQLLSFLSKEQREIAKRMGIGEVGYAINYVRYLHQNAHIIQEVRNIR